MSASAYGAACERTVMEILEAEGWVVGRSAGSRGSADLVALKAGETPRLIQVKGHRSPGLFKAFPPHERMQLKADALKAGAGAWYCRWIPAEKLWRFLHSDDWPPDAPTRHAPDYIVDAVADCWLWQKATQPDGYGICRRDRATWLAHRWYYEQAKGPIADGLQLDHLCRTRSCVNPDHLEPVTKLENQLRGDLTKLTAGQVKAIRDSDESNSIIAMRFGIGRGYTYRIQKGQARRDVKYKLPDDESTWPKDRRKAA